MFLNRIFTVIFFFLIFVWSICLVQNVDVQWALCPVYNIYIYIIYAHRICCNVNNAIRTVILLHVLCFIWNVSWVLLSLYSFLFAIFYCCWFCYCICLWLKMKVHRIFLIRFGRISADTFLWFQPLQQQRQNAINGYCGCVRNTNFSRIR